MSNDDFDMADTLKVKSDQLNAIDLLTGPITVQITGGRKTRDQQQPVIFTLSGGHMPWKPCKTMRRLLTELEGSSKGKPWYGRWVTFYTDPSVTYGKDPVGGIRVSAVSGIPKARKVTLMTGRARYTTYNIKVLKPGEQTTSAATADLDAVLADHDLTRADVDRLPGEKGKPLIITMNAEQRAILAVWLAGGSARIDAVRALIPEGE